MKLLYYILLATCAATRAAVACDFDCSLDRELRDQRLAGAVYALVDGDRVTTRATGFANAQTRQPLRADSKVHIGSVTKTLLALGALRLSTQRRVNLDAPLHELLPAVRLDNPWRDRSPVTLRHLLDHTSGLEDLRLWQFFTLRVTPRAPLGDAFTRAPDLLRVRTEPGAVFSYSNTGYTLAGMVIEAVTGERYEAWLDRELLRPLGLVDSTFEYTTQTGPAADPRLAWGHYDDLDLAAAVPVWPRPATQFTTTAGDMARIAQFLMGDGRIGDARFIDEELLRQMGRPARTRAAQAGLEVGYGLGLLLRDRHGVVGLCHTGNVVGYRAALCMYPRQRKAFFVAINSDSESARYARFDELAVGALELSTETAPVIGAQPPAESWAGRYVIYPARFERFRYFDLLFDTVRVDASADAFEWQPFGGETGRLEFMGHYLLRIAGRTLPSHVLLEDAGGRYISEGTRTWRKIPEAWLFLAWVSLVLGLAGLAALLLLIPWRAWRRGEPLLQPASLALLLLIAPAPLFAMQPFLALGDLTAASVALYIATLALAPLMLAQAAWAWWTRARLASWRVHLIATALVLQWCASLFAWDLLPFATWR